MYGMKRDRKSSIYSCVIGHNTVKEREMHILKYILRLGHRK